MNGNEKNAKNAAADAKRRTRWTPARMVEVMLLALGLICAAIFITARMEGYLSSRAAIERFESEAPAIDRALGATQEPPTVGEPDFAGWGEGRIRAYAEAAQKRRGIPLAVLKIPRIEMKAPVFDGTDELTLNHAVGLIAGTAWPGEQGNVGIAGHRDGFFRKLKDIRLGDEIELATRIGRAVYVTDRIQIVTPRDVSVLQSDGEPSLTLVTCYPFYSIGAAPKRFVVKAHLKGHNPAGMAASASRLNAQPVNPIMEEQ